MRSSPFLKIHTRMCSAALLPVQPPPTMDRVWSRVGDLILQDVTLSMWPDCLSTPRQKFQERSGPQTDKQLLHIPFQITFMTKRFCIAFYESYSSTVYVLYRIFWKGRAYPITDRKSNEHDTRIYFFGDQEYADNAGIGTLWLMLPISGFLRDITLAKWPPTIHRYIVYSISSLIFEVLLC
jgi:hypothetical protein